MNKRPWPVRLGQHILTDTKAIAAIIDAVRIEPEDIIIEIGPGTGALTQKIESRTVRLIAIEKDARFAERLQNDFHDRQDIEIIHGDALTALPRITEGLRRYKLVGNIPYYITGNLFRVISELPNKPDRCVLTIQEEVALRIAAQPPHMSMIGIATQAWALPHVLQRILPESFSPPPRVYSSVLLLEKRAHTSPLANDLSLVRAGFSHPRKLLLSNLAEYMTIPKEHLSEIFESLHISPKTRAQELSLTDWERLVPLLTVKRRGS